MSKYRLVIAGDETMIYESDSLFGLLALILQHRFWHFRRGEGWTD